MTNHKKLIWRHCVTGPELSFLRKRKGLLKIDQSVKMPWHRLSMGVACSFSSTPGDNEHTDFRHIHAVSGARLRCPISVCCLFRFVFFFFLLLWWSHTLSRQYRQTGYILLETANLGRITGNLTSRSSLSPFEKRAGSSSSHCLIITRVCETGLRLKVFSPYPGLGESIFSTVNVISSSFSCNFKDSIVPVVNGSPSSLDVIL